MLCGPIVTFTPVLVREGFHGDARHFSVAVAAFVVGGLLGAAALLGVGPEVDHRKVCAVSAMACGSALALTAMVPWFWALPPLLVVCGASITVSNIAASSLLQTTASPKLLGQTVSLYMLAMRGGISIGALATGAVVGSLGIRQTLLVDGLLAILMQAANMWWWRTAPERGARAPQSGQSRAGASGSSRRRERGTPHA
jgi:MFS family permease